MLVFLAADAARLPSLEAAVRELLAAARERGGDGFDGYRCRQVASPRMEAAEQTDKLLQVDLVGRDGLVFVALDLRRVHMRHLHGDLHRSMRST